MTQTIKLELPTDNAPVLYHMGTALHSIAYESGYVNSTPDPTMKTTKVSTLGKASVSVTTEPVIKSKLEEDLDNVTVVTDEEVAAHESQLPVLAEVTTPPIASDEEQLDMLADNVGIVRQEAEPETNDTLDKNGIPYDSRIHSRGKTRNADDTWRNARCPKGKTAEEWTAYIAEVETELKALMDIPVAKSRGVVHQVEIKGTLVEPKYWRNLEMGSCGEVNGEEELTEFLNNFPNAEPISHEQFVQFQKELNAEDEVVTPQPVVETVLPTPPVVETETPLIIEAPLIPAATPPVVEVETPVVEVETPVVEVETPKNFGELMKFITTNNKKLTSEAVKQVLADQGLASIALLAPRPDLIPQVHSKLVELL